MITVDTVDRSASVVPTDINYAAAFNHTYLCCRQLWYSCN